MTPSETKEPASIVVIGSSNVDFIMGIERLPDIGETVTDGLFQQTYGGKGANQAVAAARAGGNVQTATPLAGGVGFSTINHGAPKDAPVPVEWMTRDLMQRLWACLELNLAGAVDNQDECVRLATQILYRRRLDHPRRRLVKRLSAFSRVFNRSRSGHRPMIEIEIALPAQPLLLVPQLGEQAFAAEGLTVTLRGDLAQYPGCTHWHAKRGKERGTLEATWWPQTNRLWLKIATGRSADWIPETAARLKSRIEVRLPHSD